jgi:hypothetical protein
MENGAVEAGDRGVWQHLVCGPQPDFLGSQLRQEWKLKRSVSNLASAFTHGHIQVVQQRLPESMLCEGAQWAGNSFDAWHPLPAQLMCYPFVAPTTYHWWEVRTGNWSSRYMSPPRGVPILS